MSDPALPAWAREDAFPAKPNTESDDPYGCLDDKGRLTGFATLRELRTYLSAGKGRLAWIWTPENERFVAPEEVPELAKSLNRRRALLARDDSEAAKRGLLVFGAALAYCIFSAHTRGGIDAILASQNVGITAILFLIFGVRPWWEGRQGQKETENFSGNSLKDEIPEARFELWLSTQQARTTIILCGLIIAVFVVQFFTKGIADAALDKSRYPIEKWRLFTGPFLHGNILHLGMNLSALWYLGRRVEILARWPHLALVFLLSIIGGGSATLAWIKAPSVGISGAVCGLLGFLLVFEFLHQQLVPKPARQRMLGILFSLIVIGFFGFALIDNAAHFGGLVTGIIYAAIVFPKSSSPERPAILGQDRALGIGALAFIFLSGIGAMIVMLHRL